MLATAHVVYDRPYFEMLYDDWLQHRSVWRRYAIYASFALLAAGVMMAIASPRHWLVGAVFAMFGVYETISALTHRSRWISERLLLARADKTVDFTFDETSVASVSANGNSTMLVSSFVGFAAGANGFFLIPDTGISLYVPRASVEPADVYDALLHSLCLAVEGGSEPQNASGEQDVEPELPITRVLKPQLFGGGPVTAVVRPSETPMANLLDVIQRVRSNRTDETDWLYIADSAVDLTLNTEADLGFPDFDENCGQETEPAGFAERGLRSTIDADTLSHCIEWADQLSGTQDDNAALDIIRYYIRFDAWPETLNAPDPPPADEVLRRLDREFSDKLGPEDSTKTCRRDGCERGVVSLSVFCRRHHFENVRKRPYPFDD